LVGHRHDDHLPSGFWPVAGFVPPSDPQASVGEILSFYRGDTTAIRAGLWMTMFAAALCVPFFVVVTMQVQRIEGPRSPLAWTQLAFGALFCIEFIIPLVFWQTAAYRPELDPVVTYRLHDMGWLFFLGVVSTGVIQAVLIGVAILRDKRPEPIIPRWIGYVCLWYGPVSTPGGFIYFFKTGPFAWNGVIAFWLVLAAFCVWISSLVFGLVKYAIPSEESELAPQAEPAAAGAAPAVPAAAPAK
jgi:hypothetical protein